MTQYLQHLDNPPAPDWLGAADRAIWDHVAPQVCRWSNVTALDLRALEMLILDLRHIEQADARLAQAPPAEAAVLNDVRAAFVAMLGEWCREFLLGPEVLEEITTTSGLTLAQLLGKVGRNA